jgi:hypothetical protein
VQVLERTKGGDAPGGGILEVVAWQPNRPRKRFMQAHIDPSAVLLGPCLVGFPGALLQERIGDLVVDVLLLEHLLVRKVDLAVKVLKSCGLAKAEELVVDEAVLEVVKFVNVLHNFLTLSLYEVLDKRISANGSPKANVAINYEGLG